MRRSVSDDSWRKYALALVAGFIVVYLLTLGVRPMARLDEFRYAEIAREMLATGDWISPHLNGVRYFEKPVLGHWIGATAQWLFGGSNFVPRLPNALATGLTAIFIFTFIRRSTQDPRTGLLAAFIYLTCLAVFGVGTINILDPLLSLWLTMAVGFFYWAYVEENSGRENFYLIMMGLCCGLAFLTKGFLAFAVPVVVAFPFIVWQGGWARLPKRVAIPAITALLVALPWGIAVHLREPDFWHYFFWVEHIQRFAAENAQHSEPPWYFLLRFPLLVFPWVILAPVAIAGLRQHSFNKSLVGYLLAWLLMPLLFFSASSGKLLTYILPCMPPFAMLLALGLKSFAPIYSPGFLRREYSVLLSLYLLLSLLLVLNHFGWVGRPVFDATEVIRLLVATTGLVGCALIAAYGISRKAQSQRLLVAGLSLLPLLLVINFCIPNYTRTSKMPTKYFSEKRDMIALNAVLVSDTTYFRSVGWVFKREDVYMLSRGELAYGLDYEDTRHRLLDSEDSVTSLINKSAGKVELAFFVNNDSDARLASLLPAAAKRSQLGKYIFWHIPVQPDAVKLPDNPDARFE